METETIVEDFDHNKCMETVDCDTCMREDECDRMAFNQEMDTLSVPEVETTPEVETVEVETTPEVGLRLKRNYLRNGKVAPVGVKVFTSEKSGKTYIMKIIGTKTYVME